MKFRDASSCTNTTIENALDNGKWTLRLNNIYIYINNDLSVKNDKSHLAGTLQKEYRD